MSSQHKHGGSTLSLIEAVETLSNISEMEPEKYNGEGSVISAQDDNPTKPVIKLNRDDYDKTVHIVKETYKIILHYLKDIYEKNYRSDQDEKTTEGIKTVMVLAGEVAKKLDSLTSLFHLTNKRRVTELKEYRQLQEFYLSRIAHKVDERMLGKWILALTRAPARHKPTIKFGGKVNPAKHIFIDLETVKKDTEYELFFLRKEDGTRFFSPRLIRNIKLICDFGYQLGGSKKDDPLIDIKIWQDRLIQQRAAAALHSMKELLQKYYQVSCHHKDINLVNILNKCIMALFLSGHSSNLIRQNPVKTCFEYYVDFQYFLREAYKSNDYQKLIAYPPKSDDTLGHHFLNTIHALTKNCLFLHLEDNMSLNIIRGLIHEADQKISSQHHKASMTSSKIWSKLVEDYAVMSKLFKSHPVGPPSKVIEILQDGTYHYFDPIFQQNIPSIAYELSFEDYTGLNIRLPAPIHQENIQQASIVPEFKDFLYGLQSGTNSEKLLLINLQDRNSWKELARCKALEEMQLHHDFADRLIVVTLAKDTEFYHQTSPFAEENQADKFIKELKEQLSREAAGFYFPPFIKKALFPDFVNGVIDTIHRVFFSQKNVLLREERLDFIEIFYLFLELKLINLVKPKFFSLTCKDGLDTGNASNCVLFVFLKFLELNGLSERDQDYLNEMIYSPPIMIRERIMLPERFNRMANAIKAIEFVRQENGAEHFIKMIKEEMGRYYSPSFLFALIQNLR